ncbi:HD family phosphohydrolase [Vallitalea longa]|uniref:HD family phosphohydrolase n=1 Tax=Vallitalea longa TaxID=2936439 RepID=A0A9W5Y916_9FIRM|nr:HD-GYP domain-containing protein [Vallitalea longa]GKX28106.1 HD family phosphohydrolase [Vallitalea longa]
MEYKINRISIHDVEIGMELANDVLTSNGLILIPTNTVITQNNIFKMNLYQILSVDIKKYITPKENNIDTDVEDRDFTQKFLEFKTNYDNNKQKLTKQLNQISEGGNVNIKDLFRISNDLMKALKNKSELFNYLNHLRSIDEYTYSHSLNVSMLCNIFGQWLHLDRQHIENLTVAGLLHDIGKLSIDVKIINKPGKLTEDEFAIIEKHPEIGYDIVKNLDYPEEIKMGILMHHEKIDGSGYPLHLKDTQIHEYGKIIAIADIYDAMTSVRSYHKKTSPFKVIRLFERESYGLLDTKFLFVFLEHIAYNYLHRTVRLSNGEVGKIIFIHKTTPSKPIVDVGTAIIDMQDETDLDIEEIM